MAKIGVVTLLSVVVLVVCQVDSRPADTSSFKVNYKSAQKFACLHPQPRAVRIIDEIQTGVQGKRFIPRMAVLDRCDAGSGCCLHGHPKAVCGPVETEDVKLTFRVVYTVDSDAHKTGSTGEETLSFTNHTKCGCVIPSNDPK